MSTASLAPSSDYALGILTVSKITNHKRDPAFPGGAAYDSGQGHLTHPLICVDIRKERKSPDGETLIANYI